MASPGQRRGVCGHAMAGFDKHAHCARCRDKKKGTDPCIKGNVCPSCNILTEEQKLRLATPVYQNKKEKRESKAAGECTFVDPSLVSVIGVSTDGDKSSEEASSTLVVVKAKKNAESLEEVSNVSNMKTKKIKSPASSVAKEKPKKRQSSPTKSTKGTTDCKLEALDLKWSERFSRLEAMLLSKTLSQPEPSFQPVKVIPARPPPAGATEKAEPFFAPPQKNASDHVPPEIFITQQSDPEMDTDVASDSDSLPDIADKCEEGELSDLDQDIMKPTRLYLRNKIIGRLCAASGRTWGGRTYRI